jgi:hypothetical protein
MAELIAHLEFNSLVHLLYIGLIKKKINALSVDGRVLCYALWPDEGKKYMGSGNSPR